MAEPVMVVRVAANITELRKNLIEGTGTIETTKSAMSSMSNAFDGSRIIAQSGAVMAQIQALGGVTTLTATEQARANRILEEALEKYKAMGREAPPGMQALAVSTRSASAEVDAMAPKTGNLRVEFQKFDGVLSSLGINVTRQIKGIEDVTSASFASSAGFAKWAISIGAAAAAFKVGWDFGRWIADVTGADKAVEGLWRQLLHLGDVSLETAAAKQDVINRAIANGAKETISYTEAIKFNDDQVRKNADSNIDWAMRLAAAHKEVRSLTDAKRTEIEVAQKAGATTEELTNKYGLSTLALNLLTDRKKLAVAAAKAHEDAMKREKAASDAYDVSIANQIVLFDNLDKAAKKAMSADAAEKWIGAQVRATQASREAAAAESARVAQNQVEIDQQLAGLQKLAAGNKDVGVAAKSATDTAQFGFAGVAQQVTLSGEAVKEWISLLRYAAQAGAILSENSLFTTQSQRDRIAALPGRASGGPVSAGAAYMVGERGPEMFVPERSGTIVPNGAGGRGAAPITVNLTVNGSVLSTPSQLRDVVGGAILDIFRSGAIQIPAYT